MTIKIHDFNKLSLLNDYLTHPHAYAWEDTRKEQSRTTDYVYV